MCRQQLPVWQSLWREYADRGDFQLVSIAVDVQGAERPRPYAEKAGVTFPTLIDPTNVMGELYGFRAVPNGILINEDGTIYRIFASAFDIRKEPYSGIVRAWLEHGPPVEDLASRAGTAPQEEAARLFRKGAALYDQGQDERALELWRQARALDPENWIIRKQIWAVEHPEKFYDGEIDTRWQRQRIVQGT